MNSGTFFQRIFIALLSVIFLLSAAVVGATVKLYTATAEDYPSEVESQDISKQRALDKAIKNATKQAGFYLQTYSRTVNSELTDDEITAITSNSYKIVGEPKFTRTLKQISDETTIIVWTATVEVNVDDSEIQNWLKRDDKNKSQIISQTREALKSSEENERKVKDLRERYNRATSQAEKDKILKQMNDVDRDFLANQKFKEGVKLYYAKNYHGAIKLYNEVLAFGDYQAVYNNRGNAYADLGQYERAIQDYSKSIGLYPNDYVAYYNRGNTYKDLGKYNQAIKDYNKAIQLNPNLDMAYNNRAVAYIDGLKQYERAIQDCNKAIEVNPKNYDAYNNRGAAHYSLRQYDLAFQDFNKAIELNINDYKAYTNRGVVYFNKQQYEQAVRDFNRAIEINPHYVLAYINLAFFYKKLGDMERAQAYLKKAKELVYNG